MSKLSSIKIETFSRPMREKVKMNQEPTILKIKTTTKKATLTLTVIQKVASQVQLFRFRYSVLKNIFSELFLAKVTIVGLPEAQWRAQFCIFDKLKQEGWFGNEEGRLTSQITIPGQLVGRIIGKGGVNVRELQVRFFN